MSLFQKIYIRGAVLPMALLMLNVAMLTTVLGFLSTGDSYRTVVAVQDHDAAVDAVEMAIDQAQAWVDALDVPPVPVEVCSTSPCVRTSSVWLPESVPASFWSNTGNAAVYTPNIRKLSAQPNYVIEWLWMDPDVGAASPDTGWYYYRITARGRGLSSRALALRQVIYSRHFEVAV